MYASRLTNLDYRIMTKEKSLQERFVRWDAIRRNYFSVIINLFLTFSIGGLSFLLQELSKPDFVKNIYYTRSLILIFASVIIGVLVSTSRFCDFRNTARKIRLEEKKLERNISDNIIESIKRKMNFYGKLTLGLFYLQVATFIMAFLFNAMFVLTQYKDKLF